MPDDCMMHIPLSATISFPDGDPQHPVFEGSCYTDVPADVVARMIIRSFGRDAIPVRPEGGSNDT